MAKIFIRGGWIDIEKLSKGGEKMYKEILIEEVLIKRIGELVSKTLNSKEAKEIRKLAKERGDKEVIITLYLNENLGEAYTKDKRKYFLASYKWIKEEK